MCSIGVIAPHRPQRGLVGFLTMEDTVVIPLPAPPKLRTSVIVDYQNVHLVGHEAFSSTRNLPRHESLVDPLLFAEQLLKCRNAAQGPGYQHATLGRILVFRGLPSSEYEPDANARSLAQQAHWQRDRRVQITLRPLRYIIERGADGRALLDVNGKATVVEKREKGVDVLCALALVREAARPDTDLVILASHDTDLAPALDAVCESQDAKVEAFRWDSSDWYVNRLKSDVRNVWCTRLDERAFEASRDHTPYV